ncbi:MAG: shikimate dehydrogenase [Deltaproteobacteria bacterium]|nr:shikimate dehydrogenase [Deltaproteobacteria bacterium]
MLIDQNTSLFGVVGHPLRHSLSPVMHNTAFEVTQLNAVYVAFDAENIKDFICGVRAFGVRGVSVTIPYKSRVIKMLDELDETAEKIGAVNTIVNRDGRLIGFNTDAIGAFEALEEKIPVQGKSCIIIGAGGAARAIGYILKEKGVDLRITNRSRKRGEEFADLLSCPFIPMDRIEGADADIIVNATPVGMFPEVDRCPVPAKTFKKGMIVMDVIYNPLKTRLLSAAESRGCFVINGISMFIRQGAEQFRLWTGLEPPLEEMRQAVLRGLQTVCCKE